MYLILYKNAVNVQNTIHFYPSNLFLQNAPFGNFCVINYTFTYILPDWETFSYSSDLFTKAL
jgi:hypothetical protein